MHHAVDEPEGRRSESPSLPPGLTLAIGSMPHRDPARAIDLIVEACPEAPCWPQLPALGHQEDMIPQFTEGLPCIRMDKGTGRVYYQRPETCSEELTRFYEHYFDFEESGDLEAFALSSDYATGLHTFLDQRGSETTPPFDFVKGQITGPLTFGLSIFDEDGLPALFDEALADVVCKGIQLKAQWQIDHLKSLGDGCILFVDEPILAAFGSAAYVNLTREKAVTILREIFSAVKDTGTIVGSHCCGNTDWSLLMEAGVDIVNFDAYEYRDAVALYPDSLAKFLQKGGYLAWGIVPSTSLDNRPSVEALYDMLLQGLEVLMEKGISRQTLYQALLLTTSCGLGSLKEGEAEQALNELVALGKLVREKLCS